MSQQPKSSSPNPARRLMTVANEVNADLTEGPSAEEQWVERVIRVLDQGSDGAMIDALWSDPRQRLQMAIAKMSTAQPVTLLATPEPMRDAYLTPDVALRLRFVVGVVVRDGPDRHLPIGKVPPASTNDSADERYRHLEAWYLAVTTVFEEMLGGRCMVIVGDPNWERAAIYSGLASCNRVVLSREAFCGQRGVAPEAIGAGICSPTTGHSWNEGAVWQWTHIHSHPQKSGTGLEQMGPSAVWLRMDDPTGERNILLDSPLSQMALDDRRHEGES